LPVIALVVGKSEPLVGLHRVQPPILQRIGAQLIRKADAAAFLPQIEQYPAPLHADDPKRFLELRPAIALQ
jgi:hypothetical protein